MDGICTSETKISLSWPPAVSATLKNFEMTLQYEYISCLNNQKTSYSPATSSPGNIEAKKE